MRGDPVSLPLPNRYLLLLSFSYIKHCAYFRGRTDGSLSTVYLLDTPKTWQRKSGKLYVHSCVVAIPHEYPESDNIYTGFKIYELAEICIN